VAVHEAFTRNGELYADAASMRAQKFAPEIPQWMFDSVACCRMLLATVPTVSCGALLELKALLRCAPFLTVMLCYKVSIVPCYLQEVLMRKSLSDRESLNSNYFIRPEAVLPPETRRKTVRLLARLLREHIGRVRASGSRKEADDE